MLPLRLGTVNANGPQDLIVYALTKDGRVEAANYPNVKVPTGMDVPLYVKDEFGEFYKAMFERAVATRKHARGVRRICLEHGLVRSLRRAAAVEQGARRTRRALDRRRQRSSRRCAAFPAFMTRLHVRYDAQSFPEDITFLETHDRENFQGRYVLRHPWKGDATCPAAQAYRDQLPAAFPHQATNSRAAHRLAARRDRGAHGGDGAVGEGALN